MGEGWLRHLASDRAESLSAGAVPTGYVHPMAVQVMQEAGIDISAQRSKSIEEFLDDPPDLIIAVCDNAAANCPVFPRHVERINWPFDDPAHATGSDEERLAEFRRVRDEIRAKIEAEMGTLLC
jgi:arsenate reductase